MKTYSPKMSESEKRPAKLALLLLISHSMVAAFVFVAVKHATHFAQQTADNVQSAPRSATNLPSQSGKADLKQAESTFRWKQVESPSYTEYVGNLRKIGCPEQTIQDIIKADVNQLFSERSKAILNAPLKIGYWRSDAFNPAAHYSKSQLQSLKELSEQKRNLLRLLLGVEVASTEEIPFADPIGMMLDFVPYEKKEQILAIRSNYEARSNQAGASAKSRAEANSMRVELDKAMVAEIKSILSPEEAEAYDLRFSRVATTLRNQLAIFNPSEEEFRQIFQAQKDLNDSIKQQADPVTQFQHERPLRQAADAKIEAALGPERFAEYSRSIDPPFIAAWEAAQLNELSPETIVKVYELRKAAEEEGNAVLKDRSINFAARQEKLQAIISTTDSPQKSCWARKLTMISKKIQKAGCACLPSQGRSFLVQFQSNPERCAQRTGNLTTLWDRSMAPSEVEDVFKFDVDAMLPASSAPSTLRRKHSVPSDPGQNSITVLTLRDDVPPVNTDIALRGRRCCL